MSKQDSKLHHFVTETLPIVSLVLTPLVLIATLIFGYFYIEDQKKQYTNLELDMETQAASTTALLTVVHQTLTEADQALLDSINVIEQNLSLAQTESRNLANQLAETLSAEQEKIAQLTEETEKIGGTVGTLEKLSETDPELLQKYSKVFFLNEHYVPKELSEIKKDYLYSEKETKYIHSGVYPKLTQMIDDAQEESVTIYIKSAYRSFNEQDALKDSYSITYGEDTANTFSADQGYSEHQLGTTIDLITTGLYGQLDGFNNTPAYTWLLANAHRYGFVLSYPENNDHYIFEPWHWRYVGVALATKIHDEGLSFYDMDQRVIDEYLVSFFD